MELDRNDLGTCDGNQVGNEVEELPQMYTTNFLFSDSTETLKQLKEKLHSWMGFDIAKDTVKEQ